MFESTEFIVPRYNGTSMSLATPISSTIPVALPTQKTWTPAQDPFHLYGEELPAVDTSDDEDDDRFPGEDCDRWSESSDSWGSQESDGDWDVQLEETSAIPPALPTDLPTIVVTPPAEEGPVAFHPDLDGAFLFAEPWSFAAQYRALVTSAGALGIRLRLHDNALLRRRLQHTQALARKLNLPVHDTEWFKRPRAPRAVPPPLAREQPAAYTPHVNRVESTSIERALKVEVRVDRATVVSSVGPRTSAFFNAAPEALTPARSLAPIRTKTATLFGYSAAPDAVYVAIPSPRPVVAFQASEMSSSGAAFSSLPDSLPYSG